MARGPSEIARRCDGYIINGFRFRTKSREMHKKTQNCGVVLTARTSSFSSVSDRNPIVGDITYYGVLKNIIELDYNQAGKVVLFKCDWVDVLNAGRGMRKDEFGHTLLNLTKLCHEGQQLLDEPFVFANQVQQVFYIEDPLDMDWHFVRRIDPRDFFDMENTSTEDDINNNMQDGAGFDVREGNEDMILEANDTIDFDDHSLVRTDMDGEIVDTLLPNVQMRAVGDVAEDVTDEEDDL